MPVHNVISTFNSEWTGILALGHRGTMPWRRTTVVILVAVAVASGG
jgi:hypothetical protein